MMCLEPICMVWRHGMSSCGRRACLAVGEEYTVMENVFLLEKKNYIVMEDVFLLKKNIFSLDLIKII